MDAFIVRSGHTPKTCREDELWAICFMREVGDPQIDMGYGCAHAGLICVAPQKRFNISNGSAETYYGAY